MVLALWDDIGVAVTGFGDQGINARRGWGTSTREVMIVLQKLRGGFSIRTAPNWRVRWISRLVARFEPRVGCSSFASCAVTLLF